MHPVGRRDRRRGAPAHGYLRAEIMVSLGELRIPHMGSVENARVVAWHVEEGAGFSVGQLLYEVETDKTLTEVTADVDGVLARRLAHEGDELKVGDLVGWWAAAGSDAGVIAAALRRRWRRPTRRSPRCRALRPRLPRRRFPARTRPRHIRRECASWRASTVWTSPRCAAAARADGSAARTFCRPLRRALAGAGRRSMLTRCQRATRTSPASRGRTACGGARRRACHPALPGPCEEKSGRRPRRVGR